MNFSQLKQAIRHWRGSYRGPREARDHGGEIVSAVEAVFEFGEISRHVLAIDGAVGSGDGGLDVAKCGVDPFEGRSLGSPVSRTCVDDLMRTSGVGHAGKTVQAVADYGAIGTEAASGKCRDRRPAEAGNPSQLHANRLAFGRGFHRSDKRCLTGCSTAPFAAPALATEVGVIDLHTAGERLVTVAFEHNLLQLVLDLPGGGLRHAQASAEFDAGDALFALGEMIDRTKPKAQRQFGGGKDRPCYQRSLSAATGALKQLAAFQHAMPRLTAGGALKAIRPPRSHDNSPTLFLGTILEFKCRLAEPLLELHLVARHQKTPLKSMMFAICTRLPVAEQDA